MRYFKYYFIDFLSSICYIDEELVVFAAHELAVFLFYYLIFLFETRFKWLLPLTNSIISVNRCLTRNNNLGKESGQNDILRYHMHQHVACFLTEYNDDYRGSREGSKEGRRSGGGSCPLNFFNRIYHDGSREGLAVAASINILKILPIILFSRFRNELFS